MSPPISCDIGRSCQTAGRFFYIKNLARLKKDINFAIEKTGTSYLPGFDDGFLLTWGIMISGPDAGMVEW